MIVQSFLDFFSLAALFPLLGIIISPELIANNNYLNNLRNLFSIESTNGFIFLFTSFLLLFIVLKNLFVIWVTKTKSTFAFTIAHDQANKAISKLESITYINYTQLDYSKELNRLANYPIAFANNITLPVTVIITETLVALLLLFVVGFFNYHILLIISVILMPIFVLFKVRKNVISKIKDTIKDKYPLLLKYVTQMIEDFLEIKVSGKGKFFKKRFNEQNNALHKAFIKEQIVLVSVTRFTETILTLIICLVVLYSLLIQKNYTETLLTISIYAAAGMRLIPSINRILHAVQQINIHTYLLDDKNGAINNSIEKSEAKLLFNKSIELRDISFSYANDITIIENLSLVINEGAKIAITGNSGKGKTTLLLILLRLLKETKGELLIDGKSIENQEQEWRNRIGYVSQTPYLIDGTISENVAFGLNDQDIDLLKIERLINEVGLSDMVGNLENGIDTVIGERGAKLSGGQRQRIMIARALYANVDILLLDEATSQVHRDAELELIKLLNSAIYKNKTIIMVTHKIPKTDFFNEIYTLENGVLVRQ